MSKDNQNDIHTPYKGAGTKPPLDDTWAAKRRLADELRHLIEVLVTSSNDAESLNAVADIVHEQAEALKQSPPVLGRFAYEKADDGKYGSMPSIAYELSPLDGRANPIAAPMNVWIDHENAEVKGDVTMAWQYEGPPGCVHGGFVAAVFDHFLGIGQKLSNDPGVTGTLSIRYIKPTPLNTQLTLIGKVKSEQGRKKVLVAEMWAGDVLTASCEGLFISFDFDTLRKLQQG